MKALGLLAALLLAPSVACCPASTSPVRLNEIMPSNDGACHDENGDSNDWIELFNPSNVSIDLSGYSMSDDTSQPYKSVLPRGTVIPALGTLLLWADGSTGKGATHLDFSLQAASEEVVLYDTDARQVDIYHWTNAEKDRSFARIPDGAGRWVPCRHSSCGMKNASGCGG